jgi:hypothetical protein
MMATVVSEQKAALAEPRANLALLDIEYALCPEDQPRNIEEPSIYFGSIARMAQGLPIT